MELCSKKPPRGDTTTSKKNAGPSDAFTYFLCSFIGYFEWGKFYQKKSYPNWRGKVIHTNKSHKFFYPEELSKNILLRLT